jgi:hypothetical protein
MDWFRIHPTHLQAAVCIHGLSLESQGFLLQVLTNVARFDAALPLESLIAEVRPALTARRRDAIVRELEPVLKAYIDDVTAQVESYAEKSEKARAAGQKGGKASGQSRAKRTLKRTPKQVVEPDKIRLDPPYSPPRGDIAFERFWKAYPRHVGKAKAEAAWTRLDVTSSLLDAMLRALAWQTASEAWTRDDGKFIPHPATWLNGRRWEDEPAPTTNTPASLQAIDWEVA